MSHGCSDWGGAAIVLYTRERVRAMPVYVLHVLRSSDHQPARVLYTGKHTCCDAMSYVTVNVLAWL